MRLKREQSIDGEPANLIKEWNPQIGRVETDIKNLNVLFSACSFFMQPPPLKGIAFSLIPPPPN